MIWSSTVSHTWKALINHPVCFFSMSKQTHHVCNSVYVFCFRKFRWQEVYTMCYEHRTYKYAPSTCFFRYPAGRHTFYSYRNSLFLLRPTFMNIPSMMVQYRISNVISVCDTTQASSRPTFPSSYIWYKWVHYTHIRIGFCWRVNQFLMSNFR